MLSNKLILTVQSKSGESSLEFSARRLICGGWVGRDDKSLKAHVAELEKVGIAPPTKTPIHMNLSTNLVNTADTVEVISPETSGEVEYVYLKAGDTAYVGVGSDHTDRGFEIHSVPASKQLYPKVMAPMVWPYDEVQSHWDQLIIRSWMTLEGERMLYQEDPLAAILDVAGVLGSMPGNDDLPQDDFVLFSGTVASKMGMVYGESFEIELEDPVLQRRIRHGYSVRVLPQYV